MYLIDLASHNFGGEVSYFEGIISYLTSHVILAKKLWRKERNEECPEQNQGPNEILR